MGFVYIALTILFTVYGQLIIKWQISKAGMLPNDLFDKILFLLSQFTNPWILSGFATGFAASLCWMAAMTKFELSFAYPFMSLSFAIVMILSILFFGELFAWNKVIGTLIIIMGLYISGLR
jgi:drug/metabolite transporter (DMT)-like permease